MLFNAVEVKMENVKDVIGLGDDGEFRRDG